MLSACTASTDTYISTTKLAVEYNNGYVYFYRHCDNFGCQGDEFSLVQYNTKTSEEKELKRTNTVVGVRVYDDNIYYFDKDDHNLYALNEKSLKSKMIYDTQNSLAKNDYICFNSKLAYLDTGVLNIEYGDEKYHIENVWDFNVYKNQIYYVEVNINTDEKNEWSIKKLMNEKTSETETVLNLSDVKTLFEDAFREEGKIDDISICDDKLYFTVGEYPISSCLRLYCFDLKNRKIDRITEEYIYEYQATDDAVYCLAEDRTLKKCIAEHTILLQENIYSFKVTDDFLIYMNTNDDTLHIKSWNKDIAIHGVLS